MAREGEKRICPLSDPAKPHTLSHRTGTEPPSECISCGKREVTDVDWLMENGKGHYHCTTCDVPFHQSLCHLHPMKIIHPFHLQHPLILTFKDRKTGVMSDGNIGDFSSDEYRFAVENQRKPDTKLLECSWCGNYIAYQYFYHCSICGFRLDLACAKQKPPPTVSNPKSHHHMLNFFPRPLSVPCDACGLVDKLEPSYACFQCNYIVHRSCTDLPRVIKITRHPHRLFYTPFLSPLTVFTCRVCYKTVDTKYGQYSCNQEGCSYVVHSKCATHTLVWDGRELEWELEEPDNPEEAPYKKVGCGLIQYFSHDHHLKLEKYDGARDVGKQCEVCILPIGFHDFYNCLQCDFCLHEVCANLPRKLDHALHIHPLVLDPSPSEDYLLISCSACRRRSSGFRYKCVTEGCTSVRPFHLDIGCILIPERFTHKSHEHPLFIAASMDYTSKITCNGCEREVMMYYLQCTQCEFAICCLCASIPDKIPYRYDEHALSLCYGEDVADGDVNWCEICEKNMEIPGWVYLWKQSSKDWFYTCNKCCITVHRECISGPSLYMKAGYTFYINSRKVEVVRNGISTRPICHQCNHRCPSPVYFKVYKLNEILICSLPCLQKGTEEKIFGGWIHKLYI